MSMFNLFARRAMTVKDRNKDNLPKQLTRKSSDSFAREKRFQDTPRPEVTRHIETSMCGCGGGGSPPKSCLKAMRIAGLSPPQHGVYFQSYPW